MPDVSFTNNTPIPIVVSLEQIGPLVWETLKPGESRALHVLPGFYTIAVKDARYQVNLPTTTGSVGRALCFTFTAIIAFPISTIFAPLWAVPQHPPSEAVQSLYRRGKTICSGPQAYAVTERSQLFDVHAVELGSDGFPHGQRDPLLPLPGPAGPHPPPPGPEHAKNIV